MLAPRQIIFTAVEGSLLDSATHSWAAAAEALGELARRLVPLVLVSRGTRAQLEPLRRKIEHTHPFITESGGALFLPDGYFALRLEGAVRAGRYFCVPFGRPYADAIAASEEIAQEAGANIVGYSQMNPREIAGNTGEPLREAEWARQREFSERFFFAGDADGAAGRFEELASRRGWKTVRGDPFWEIYSGNSEARALRYLMGLYRTSSKRARLGSVAIGSTAEDSSLLSAADHCVVLPRRGREFDPALVAHVPKAIPGETSGSAGWNQAVLQILENA